MYCGVVLGKSQRIAQAGLVIQMVLPQSLKRLKLQLQSNILVSNAHLLLRSASLLKRVEKSLEAQALPPNPIFLSKSEAILKNTLWQSLYSKSEHLHTLIVFSFF